ncbi:MAG: hypothetical protein GX163_09630 [Bacteroidetes bacterium]|jgi:hypothetical protein|nr:hypothetical protein [Bacteroidota bacterium]
MNRVIPQVLIGVLAGIVANCVGMYLYLFFVIGLDDGIGRTLRWAVINDVIGKIIALGALMNLLVFFVFIKKGQLYRARGVMIATLFATLGILISKFL